MRFANDTGIPLHGYATKRPKSSSLRHSSNWDIVHRDQDNLFSSQHSITYRWTVSLCRNLEFVFFYLGIPREPLMICQQSLFHRPRRNSVYSFYQETNFRSREQAHLPVRQTFPELTSFPHQSARTELFETTNIGTKRKTQFQTFGHMGISMRSDSYIPAKCRHGNVMSKAGV